jgi:hypothetical protein
MTGSIEKYICFISEEKDKEPASEVSYVYIFFVETVSKKPLV